MKVKLCENCKHYKRLVWSQSYEPADYHRIGLSHAYGYCSLHEKRCLEVKKCEKGEEV